MAARFPTRIVATKERARDERWSCSEFRPIYLERELNPVVGDVNVTSQLLQRAA